MPALTSFVGRAGPVREVTGLLGRDRLVTVTGPGGAGKTRLAGQVAKLVAGRFADGAWLAELAPVRDPALVPAVVAAALGVRSSPACRRPGRWRGYWPGSSCCWCWTTASTSPARPRSCAPGCWRPVMRCGCWRPAGSRCGWLGRPGTGWDRWACPAWMT